MSDQFDPRRTVILESPAPIESAENSDFGKAEIVESSTDHMVVNANLQSPAMLLITDAYSAGWRVRDISEGPKKPYVLMRADYCLQAVPLTAGTHRILIEYAPASFRLGCWISAISAIAYSGCLIGWLIVRVRSARGVSEEG